MINLYINERRVGDVTILDLKGRARVGGTTVGLHRSIHALLSEEKTLILLNLFGVTYVDSCGLGEIVASFVTARARGGDIKLLQVTDSLRELMSMTNLLSVFDVYENERDALASFAKHPLRVKQPQHFFV
ncbi:MAG TPA: STAS domain-containing protein [Pyrinomonadaceae bacterium]|nr:STAS domain-containing protein [Pyrinomonadaceae bacterium]